MSIPNHLQERLLSICGTPEDRDALIEAIETGGGDLTGDEIAYDNTDSGLTATDVQAAIDELAATPGGAVDSVNGQTGDVVLTATDVGAANTNLSNLGLVASTITFSGSTGIRNIGSATVGAPSAPFQNLHSQNLNIYSGTTAKGTITFGPDLRINATDGVINVVGAIISELATPVAATDAANKAYVDLRDVNQVDLTASSYIVVPADDLIVATCNTALRTVTLNDTPALGEEHQIKNSNNSANTFGLEGGLNTIDGGSSVDLDPGMCVTVTFDGVEWVITNKYTP